ncbi:uncharacterized protein TrAtP1_005710 [Trichoderma atroviride]|uniref:uncharacterized protein n=1 Tax=Hypocrea atroviridis TaxID=63577 RepID=UPI00332B72C1|nr:hypothetical protein TrAtP1_005710 [Trichoderma atroviride]
MIKPGQAPKTEQESARGFALEKGTAGEVEEAGRRTCFALALDGREARTNLGG